MNNHHQIRGVLHQGADKPFQILKGFTPERLIEYIYQSAFDIGQNSNKKICILTAPTVPAWHNQVSLYSNAV